MGGDLPFCQVLGHPAAILWGICVLWWSTCWRCHGWSQRICGEVHDPNVQGKLVKKLFRFTSYVVSRCLDVNLFIHSDFR